MSKKLLSGPYLMWMIGFTIIPLALIVFYGLTDRSGAFTLANILSIATAEHRKALWLSLGLSLVSTIICFILAYPLALILRSRGIGQGSFIVFIFILPMWMNFLLRTLAFSDPVPHSAPVKHPGDRQRNHHGVRAGAYHLRYLQFTGRKQDSLNRQCHRAGIYQGKQLEPGFRPLSCHDDIYLNQYGADRQIR